MESSNNNIDKSKVETTKKKSPRACAPCRKRKVKCNSGTPCDRCLRNNVECIYDKPQQKKEMPKPVTDSHEPRLKNLKEFLNQFSKYLDISDPKPPLYLNPNPIQTNIIGSSKLSISTTGQGYYVPDKLLRIDRVPSIYHQSLNQSDTALSDRIKQDILPTQTHALDPIHHHLLHLYFDYVDPVIPILHKSSFFYEIKNLQTTNLLLNSIYCVSSRWDLSTQQTKDPRGWYYYQRAVSLLDKEKEPSLPTLQAIFLLLKYNEHVRRPGFIWRTRYYFQMIVRMCKDLGLSRDLPLPSLAQALPVEVEKRKRTFWAIFSYDVMTSIEHGVLPNFSYIDCSIEYPDLLPDESEEEEKIIHFKFLSKVMKHQFDIIQFLHCKYKKKFELNWNEQDRFSRLSNELSLTLHYIRANTKFPTLDQICYSVSFLYLAVSFSSILLYRPFMSDDPTYQQHCVEAAQNIKKIVELLYCVAIENMYCSIRGIQQIVHYLSSANTIFKQLNLTQDYDLTMDLTKRLASISPATEVIGHNLNEIKKRKSFHMQPFDLYPPYFDPQQLNPQDLIPPTTSTTTSFQNEFVDHNSLSPHIPNHESLLGLLYNEDEKQ